MKRDRVRSPSNVKENLNNEEFDVTWGGKKSRYLYTFKLQSPLPQMSTDTDESETNSVGSTQTKSTVEAISVTDSSIESYLSDCCICNDYKEITNENEEFEVRSSSCHNIHSDSSDSSIILTKEISHNIKVFNDMLPDIDNRYNEDTDYQLTTPNIKLTPPACFQKCLQCGEENSNPYFQFCFICFRYRKEFFGKRPEPKNIKKLKKKISNSIKETNSKKSDSNNMFPNVNKPNEDIGENKDNLCIICCLNQRNGIINHGKIGHIVTCYSCAKHLWSTSNTCPMCNVKIKCVTKLVVD